jgi:glucosylceramidase
MTRFNLLLGSTIILLLNQCTSEQHTPTYHLYQTSAKGDKLTKIQPQKGANSLNIHIDTSVAFQSIVGFGGAFTESSAYVLNQLSKENRERVLDAYFSKDGARYSLTRTHMNSCDFSLDHYSYAPVEGDTNLEHFSIAQDKDDLIPLIKDAMKKAHYPIKIIASPWTAPPWMKTNLDWYGGKLEKKYYATWARFFSKYTSAYAKEGIPIWGFTVENEPLGNNSNWESMHFTPHEMSDFIKNHLGPQLKKDSINAEVFIYDQNRGKELEEWASVLLTDPEVLPYIGGTAIHWYRSTYDYFPKSLNFTHQTAPNKQIIQTEACVDAQVPRWKDDVWYWKKEATDWGWDWATDENKYLHPKYIPAHRYARDIIGCMNNWVTGWVDWNMVLDRQGGPNLAQNWCTAPIIADTENDEVYFTPLYYVLSHFSKFIQPGAKRIGFTLSEELDDNAFMITAFRNPDEHVVVVFFNPSEIARSYQVTLNKGKPFHATIEAKSIQTLEIIP